MQSVENCLVRQELKGLEVLTASFGERCDMLFRGDNRSNTLLPNRDEEAGSRIKPSSLSGSERGEGGKLIFKMSTLLDKPGLPCSTTLSSACLFVGFFSEDIQTNFNVSN